MALLSGVTRPKARWIQVSGTSEEELEWKQVQNAAGGQVSHSSQVSSVHMTQS